MSTIIKSERDSIANIAYRDAFLKDTSSDSLYPLFICGDALDVLHELPSASIDCTMTSPPYWGHRQYDNGGIGLEERYDDYIKRLLMIFQELRRVLKPTGSFWLNIGDSYHNKTLTGIPWRLALAMIDEQQWILRNDVIWNKVKGGPDNASDKLRTTHEYIFHFVKESKGYYYDADAIHTKPGQSRVVNGSVILSNRGKRHSL